MGRDTARRKRVLIAHPDHAWVDRAKSSLEHEGFEVTVCPEVSWVADLLADKRSFDLVAISNEVDPMTQAQVVKEVRKSRRTKLLLLLDALDSSSLHYRRDSDLLTHRLSNDDGAFVQAVVQQVGRPQASE